jgi:hypothetical protein
MGPTEYKDLPDEEEPLPCGRGNDGSLCETCPFRTKYPFECPF